MLSWRSVNVGRGALLQGLFDLGELGIRQPWRRAAQSFAAQPIGPTGLPAAVPDAHGLGGDAELAGDLGLAHAGGEQLGRAQPPGLEPVTFSLCRSAARDGWHGRHPHPPRSPAPTRPASSTRHPSSFKCSSDALRASLTPRSSPLPPAPRPVLYLHIRVPPCYLSIPEALPCQAAHGNHAAASTSPTRVVSHDSVHSLKVSGVRRGANVGS
jgi:hypothetical protein